MSGLTISGGTSLYVMVYSYCFCFSSSDDDFGLPTKATNKEITEQLIKDGYNLDLLPDDEDLDLIPPRPMVDRCVCCQVQSQGCSIQ